MALFMTSARFSIATWLTGFHCSFSSSAKYEEVIGSILQYFRRSEERKYDSLARMLENIVKTHQNIKFKTGRADRNEVVGTELGSELLDSFDGVLKDDLGR